MWFWGAVAVGLSLCLLGLFPVIHHLVFGFRERRWEILGYLDYKATDQYFKRYYRAELEDYAEEPRPSHEEAKRNNRAKLISLYDRRFGRRTFILSLLIYTAALILAVGIIIVIPLKPILGIELPPNFPVTDQVGWAMAGAYLWVISDLLIRYRRRDLTPSALFDAAFRFAIAVPLALTITVILPKEGSPISANAVAFILGVFPTNSLLSFLRRTAQKWGLGDDRDADRYELEDLQGVNTTMAERFAEIGIMTFLQLAYEDPIQLTMRMNLPFRVTLDIMSQAIFALYFSVPDPAGQSDLKQKLESARRRLEVARRYLIRSSIDAGVLFSQYTEQDETDPEMVAQKKRASEIIKAIADDLRTEPEIVAKIFFEIGEDPSNKFMNAIPY